MAANFPETFQFHVPRGFSRALAEVAAREGLAASAYLRRLALLDMQQTRPQPSHGQTAAD